LRIAGAGYFIVRDPTEGTVAVTRSGEFSIDATGYLVGNTGMRVQGVDDSGLTQVGDIQIGVGYADTSAVQAFDIQSDGTILVFLADGTEVVEGPILLQNFVVPANLKPFLYGKAIITTSAQPLAQPAVPGSQGLGTLVTGELESPIPLLALTQNHPASPNSSQGVLTTTGIQTDLAIEGQGFFVVRDTNSSVCYATRAGAFYLDASGHLVNYAGMRLQGFTNSSLDNIGDIAINTSGIEWLDPYAPMAGYSIDLAGRISAWLADGTSFSCGRILLSDRNQPSLLLSTNFGLYFTNSVAEPWQALAAPGSTNLGWVVSGSLELSQLDQSILDVRRRLNFFQQGSMALNGIPTDLAINGPGFFTVRDPVKNVYYATRNGSFQLDTTGRLVDTHGFRVQGNVDPSLSTVGDIVINTSEAPGSADASATIYAFDFCSNGDIDVMLSDGTTFLRGQILLQNYQDLQALVPVSGQLYSNLPAALPLFNNGAPATQGMGTLVAGSLESPTTNLVLQLPPQTGLRLLASGLVGTARVETSTDLVSWSDVGQVTGSVMEEAEWFDTNSISSSTKFYRIH